MIENKQAVTAETRAALHEVLAAFEGFKASNDERIAGLEAKRADVLLEEKVERIDGALQTATARLERLSAEARRPVLGGVERKGGEPERDPGFHAYMRAGVEMKAGLKETAPSTGGYIAPPEIDRAIERRLQAASPMREICSVRTIGASVFKKPVSIAGVATGWVAETAARPETDPATLALLEFPAADLYANPAATQSLLDDAFVNLEEWLAGEVEDAFAAQETEAFTTGNGTNKPKGFLAYDIVAEGSHEWGKLGYVATGAAGAFASSNPADKLFDLIYTPAARYRSAGRFVMNRRTTAAIRKFKDTAGAYIWSPGTQPGAPATLLGYPVTENEFMPDVAANSYSVAFGDFAKGYLIVDRAGVRVLRDPYSAKPYVLFYTLKRVGGGVQNFDAVKLLKFAAS